MRTFRCMRWIAGLLPLALVGVFRAHGRERLRERGGLVLWHLAGRPAVPVLAEVLARETERGSGS